MFKKYLENKENYNECLLFPDMNHITMPVCLIFKENILKAIKEKWGVCEQLCKEMKPNCRGTAYN